MKTQLVWTPAKVGCYWNAADFTISTSGPAFGPHVFPASAYVLTRNFEELGRFKTLKAAQKGAEAVLFTAKTKRLCTDVRCELPASHTGACEVSE